jgi:hypothetical protein
MPVDVAVDEVVGRCRSGCDCRCRCSCKCRRFKVIFISKKVEERTASTKQNSAAFASGGQQCQIKEQGTTAENRLSR